MKARALLPALPKPCWMAKQPAMWAPSASKVIPFEAVAGPGGALAMGYAQDDKEAVGIVVDLASGEVRRPSTTRARTRSSASCPRPPPSSTSCAPGRGRSARGSRCRRRRRSPWGRRARGSLSRRPPTRRPRCSGRSKARTRWASRACAQRATAGSCSSTGAAAPSGAGSSARAARRRGSWSRSRARAAPSAGPPARGTGARSRWSSPTSPRAAATRSASVTPRSRRPARSLPRRRCGPCRAAVRAATRSPPRSPGWRTGAGS